MDSSSDTSGDAEQLYRAGLAANGARDRDDAIQKFSACVRLNPDHALAHQELGWLNYFWKLDLERAASHLRRAVELDDTLGRAHLYLGIVLNRLRHADKAESHFGLALLYMKDLALAHATFAEEFLWHGGRYDEAEEHFKIALSIDPDCTLARRDYARMLGSLGREDEAERLFLEALQDDENSVWTNYWYAQFLSECKGREAESEQFYQRSLSIDPNQLSSLTHYGILLLKLSRMSEAESFVRRALEVDDRYADAWMALGMILASSDEQSEEAERAFLAGLRHEPENTNLLLEYGDFLLDHSPQRLQEALIHLGKAVELSPRRPYAYLLYGAALSRVPGREEDAELYLGVALGMELDEEGAGYARCLLDSLHRRRSQSDST